MASLKEVESYGTQYNLIGMCGFSIFGVIVLFYNLLYYISAEDEKTLGEGV